MSELKRDTDQEDQRVRELAARALTMRLRRQPKLADAVNRRAMVLTDWFLTKVAEERASHPARDTVKIATKKLMAQFSNPTSPLPRHVTTSNDDIKSLIKGSYEKNSQDVRAAAEAFDELATHAPLYYEEAASVSENAKSMASWENMTPSQKLWYSIGVADQKMISDVPPQQQG